MVDFVRKPTKKSLLAQLKRGDKMTPSDWSRVFEGVMFKSEYDRASGGGGAFVRTDGTTPLTANWDVGAFDVRAADLTADGGGVYTDTVTELTGAVGVTIDGVVIKDNGWTATADCSITTGDLYLDDASDPSLYLREGGAAAAYTRIQDNTAVTSKYWKVNAGEAIIQYDPVPTDNTSAARFRLFRETNTSGTREFAVFLGDGTATVQHALDSGTGDANLCQQAGQTTIGGTGGASKLTVIGSFAVPVTTQTAATLTLTAAHYTALCDATSNTVTITLPTAVGADGRIYNVKAINVDNAVELAADGTEEIDGSTTNISFALMETVTVQSDNANWWII
ncbi:MAG: hypothetical protein KAS32_31035 [Candidatus Peribacteraceae bacterium]|nr:hypothetical protein [Candidatus Peribacteraceae bacterium]